MPKAKKTPPPFKPLEARKGQAIVHLLVSVDLKGISELHELGAYELKNPANMNDVITRIRVGDADAEVYYVPVVLPVPKKARPVKTAKAKAKKIAKPKQAKVDTKQQAPAKKSRAKKAMSASRAPEPHVLDDVTGDYEP